MAENLPDEILSEILSPALKVPDHKFSDISLMSPFATYSESSSAVLLVSKAWLRVSTPLLYHVVVVRSRPQAVALAVALQGSHNLGRFVKKLRLEGGFGNIMHQILKCMPNITDLFISGVIVSPDTTSGLVLGLPLINPTRLILFEGKGNPLRNKWVVKLVAALEAGLRTHWTNVTTVVLTYEAPFAVRMNFLDALCSSPTVKIVSVGICSHSLLRHLAKIPSLKTIDMTRVATKYLGDTYMSSISMDPLLTKLVKFAEPEFILPARVVDILPTDPTFRPMSSATSSVADAIWARILFFAVLGDDAMNSVHSRKPKARRLSFVLVSQTFKRLALPYLYRYPILWFDSEAERLGEALVANPALGLHIREIHRQVPLGFRYVPRHGLGYDIETRKPDFAAIFWHTPRLDKLVGNRFLPPLLWDAFEALAHTAGTTLVEFGGFVVEDNSPVLAQCPTILAQFMALQSLTWRSPTVFCAPLFPKSSVLPALEFLEVASPGIFPAFQHFDLPKLHRLVLDASITSKDCSQFLRRHGPKLIHLKLGNSAMVPTWPSVFQLCPAITRLELSISDPETDNDVVYPLLLAFPEKHQALVQLVVNKTLARDKKADVEQWRRFLEGSAWADFPALREISAAPFSWPTDERAISKSPWVGWAEAFLEKQIKLTDKAGTHWRPRLKGGHR